MISSNRIGSSAENTLRQSIPFRTLRCILAILLMLMLAAPSLALPRMALAGNEPAPASNTTWDELKPFLERGLGVPYLFGGSDESGWDCSGYASWAFSTCGNTNYTHYTTTFENELAAQGSFVMQGAGGDLRDERMEPGDIIFFYSAGVSEPTHMGIIGERVDGIVMVYHAFTNSFADIYGNRGTMLQGLDANPGSTLPGIWNMTSGHGKGHWSKFTVYRGVTSTGSLALAKSSANADMTDRNENYSLEGAVYGVYPSHSQAQDSVDAVTTMTTDTAGKAQVDHVKRGTYYIKEISPSPGFALDETVYEATVNSGEITTKEVKEVPQSNPVSLLASKADSDTDRNEAQGDASLAKAQFEFSFYGGQYSSRAEAEAAANSGAAKRVWTMQTDESGRINPASPDSTFPVHGPDGSIISTEPYFVSGDSPFTTTDGRLALPLGTLIIREVMAPQGYLISDSSDHLVNVTGSGTEESVFTFSVPSVSEQVQRGGIAVGKIDRENGRHLPSGSATLAGAVFSIVNDSAASVVVDGIEFLPGSVVAAIETDENGCARTTENALPFGTYIVTETKAPDGYLLDANSRSWSKTVQIRKEAVYDLTDASDSVTDQVKRGDFSFSKVDGRTMERLADVPFLITSKTTGEAHVVVSDENGMVDTSASWNPHTHETNANDRIADIEIAPKVDSRGDIGIVDVKPDPRAGIWFSGRADIAVGPDDSLGALPYDTYIVKEIPCKANTDKALVSFAITVSRDKANLDLGTVDDNPGPSIRTELTTVNGGHISAQGTSVTLIDEVTYDGLTPGKAYTIKGTLHAMQEDANGKKTDAGAVRDVNGNEVAAETTFEASAPEGAANVEFTFDTSASDASAVVAFETLEVDGNVAAEHSDIADEKQTVWFPSIKTNLYNKNEGTTPSAEGKIVLVDEVSFEGLAPGKPYSIEGELHVRSKDGTDSGIAFDKNGLEIRSSQLFVPESSHGTVSVAFSFEAPDLAGETVVAYEKLTDNGIVLTEHADISDNGQSISFPTIATTARCNESDSSEIPSVLGKATIIDTVKYRNLIEGKTYTLQATPHLASISEDGTIADAGTLKTEEGTEICAQASFTAGATSGTADVKIEIDPSKLKGETIVMFEKCYDGETLVAAHADINAKEQTLTVPSIMTLARDGKTASHEGSIAKNSTIVDVIRFENLTPGKKYSVTGSAHIVAEDGKNADREGIGSNSMDFIPDAPNGEVEVAICVDSTKLEGKTAVVFEQVKDENTLIAAHEDASSKPQSVSYPAPKAEVPGKKPGLTKTGDQLKMAIGGLLTVAAVGIATAAVAIRRRRG